MLFTPMGLGSDTTVEDVEQVSRMWWLLLLTGMITAAAGVVILAVDWTPKGLAIAVGTMFVVHGVFRATSPALSPGARRFDVVTGILWGLAGIAFIAWPEPTLLVLAVFVGATLIVDGIMHIAGAIEFRNETGSWWLSALAGVAVAAIGILALRRPDLTLSTLVLLAGLWAIVIGAAEITSAFVLRHAAQEMERALGGGQVGVVEETIVLGRPLLGAEEQLGLLDQLHLSGGVTDAEYDRLRGRMMGATVGRRGSGPMSPD